MQCRKKDSGKYLVQLSNNYDQATFSIHVDVLDVPSRPKDFEVGVGIPWK